MDRREFLASGATLAAVTVGGCTGGSSSAPASDSSTSSSVPSTPPPSEHCSSFHANSTFEFLAMERVSDLDIARRVANHVTDGLGDDADGRVLGWDPAAVEAIENGSATLETSQHPSFEDGEPFVYEESLYALSSQSTGMKSAKHYSFELTPVEGSVAESERVRFADLPAVDREKFEGYGKLHTNHTTKLYLDSELSESVLAPEPDRPIVVYESGQKVRFEVTSSESHHVWTYRITAELRDSSAANYGAKAREKYAFELSDLTEAERNIVQYAIAARSCGLPEDERPPEAMWRLADRFRPQDDVEFALKDDGDENEDSVKGEYLVRYEGRTYWAKTYIPRTVRVRWTTSG